MQARQRAPRACQHCRASKIRCDVAQVGVPCSKCQERGEDNCQLLPSRRGRGDVTRRRSQDRGQVNARSVWPSRENGSNRGEIRAGMDREPPTDTATLPSTQAATIHLGFGEFEQPRSASNPTHAASMRSEEQPLVLTNTPSITEGDTWVAAFEAFLSSRGQDRAIEKASITFLGESFPLAHVLGGFRQGIRMNHSTPQAVEASPSEHERGTHLSREDERYLKSKGCLSLPSDECLAVLTNVFVEKVYPLYPVVILEDFLRQSKTRSLPLILLHAACCAACSFSTLAQLTALGFTSRNEARNRFYQRAKLLFDFGYETNKITILQSTTLLSFWPSRPRDTWTFYHWISFSVTLSESLGIHRSMKGQANIPEKDRSLLTRIWWVLVLRDVYSAALFGRPVRINEMQCDADPVVIEDFVHDWTDSPCTTTQSLYFIHVTRLAMILRPIFAHRFHPAPEQQQQASVEASRSNLLQWRVSLPIELEWDNDQIQHSIYSDVLSILYNNTLILAHIPDPAVTAARGPTASVSGTELLPDADTYTEMSREGAESILDVASSLVTQDGLLSVPHEIFTGIFLAEVVLCSNVSNTGPVASKLASSQLTSFQMIWYHAKDFWEPASWITLLFKALSPKSSPKSQYNAGLSQSPALNFGTESIFYGDIFSEIQSYVDDLGTFDQDWLGNRGLGIPFE